MSLVVKGRVTPTPGQIWKHTKTGNTYVIIGSAFNTITDRVEVLYEDHAQSSDYSRFTRQLANHPKSFMSENEDGSKRFILVALDAKDFMRRYFSEAEPTHPSDEGGRDA